MPPSGLSRNAGACGGRYHAGCSSSICQCCVVGADAESALVQFHCDPFTESHSTLTLILGHAQAEPLPPVRNPCLLILRS